MSKPENQGPPEHYYDEHEARKYTTNSRIRKVQYELSQRAYELLELPEGKSLLLLDIGCGSGLSGEVLSENGHKWIGLDISQHMLKIAKNENEVDEDLLQLDMGSGLPFRAATFDGAISISAVQWLCHSNSKAEKPRKRLSQFFESLFGCLTRSARAVFQFYPESQQQCELISQQALRAGFQGGIVVDHPDSPKQRKVFLVLSAGKEAAIIHQLPALKKPTSLLEEDGKKKEGDKNHIQMIGRRREGKDIAANRRGRGIDGRNMAMRKQINKKKNRTEKRKMKAANRRAQRFENDEEDETNMMEM